MEKIMETAPTNSISLEWVLGGIATGGVLTAAFLWTAIKTVRRELMGVIERLKGTLQKENSDANQRVLEAERRFALKSDVDALRSHMDDKHEALAQNMNQRFDQLTTLIIQGRHQ